MFTKKPEREGSEDAFQRLSERPGVEMPPPPERSSPRGSSGKVVPSVIGEDLTIVGNVTSKGEIQLEGHVQGDIHCGSILLGEKSQVTGGVIADEVVVRGRVMGSIRGVRVTLQAPSHVEGDVFHQTLAIEQGAYFEGKSRRSDNPLATPKQPDEKPGVVVTPTPSNRAAE